MTAAGTSAARLLPALSNLAEAPRWQRHLDSDSITGSRIVEVQRRAATLTDVSPADTFAQADRWAQDAAAEGRDEVAMTAYALAVAQTTEVAWIGLGVVERLRLLSEMDDVLSRAVGHAAASGHPWTAVTWADHVAPRCGARICRPARSTHTGATHD